MDKKYEFLKAMYFEKKDSFGFDKLVIEMVDSKMIDVDLKRNGEIIDGAIFILKKGIEYFGKITNQNRNNWLH